MISKSDTPIHFYKAHTGVVGDEFANAIAKHAALHDYGNYDAFLPLEGGTLT